MKKTLTTVVATISASLVFAVGCAQAHSTPAPKPTPKPAATRPAPLTTQRANNGVLLSHYPHCASDDGSGPTPCVWDAATQGNGKGRTFYKDIHGVIQYVK